MANLNDFKTVGIASRNYSKYLQMSPEQIEKNGERFGFYFLILEYVTNIKELNELKDMIIDTSFLSEVCHTKNNDLGVDAVNINEDNRTIQLFNFKYRENFKDKKGQKLGDMVDVSKFLMPIYNENTDGIDLITKTKIECIIKKLKSPDIWNIELYMVSNDNVSLKDEDSTLKQIKEHFGMEIKTIVLDDIISYISGFPEDLSAQIIVDSNAVMTYEIDDLSSSKSYLIKLPLAELIRITCTNKDLRNENITDYNILKKQDLELSLLFDNVRGYLGSTTKFNKNIIKTIQDQPNKFFMFNNGITMTAKSIVKEDINGAKKFSCRITGFQIVNGGQTIRTIYEFCHNSFDQEKLANAEILVRLFQTATDKQLTNNIAEYTNSQNAISSVDLKSISDYQIKIGTYLEKKDILYVRKSGDTGNVEESYKYRISMEKVAQLLYSYSGYPDRATNQKKALFEKYYDEIFDEEKLEFELLEELILKYFSIEKEYQGLEYKNYHQKYLYIIFLLGKHPDKSVKSCIELLEKKLESYKADEKISSARKLIQKGFKDHVSNELIKK